MEKEEYSKDLARRIYIGQQAMTEDEIRHYNAGARQVTTEMRNKLAQGMANRFLFNDTPANLMEYKRKLSPSRWQRFKRFITPWNRVRIDWSKPSRFHRLKYWLFSLFTTKGKE